MLRETRKRSITAALISCVAAFPGMSGALAQTARGYEYLLDAVELAPLHAPAHAGLADAYILLGSYNLMPLSESHARARESALRAIEPDPGLAEAWTSLAAATG